MKSYIASGVVCALMIAASGLAEPVVAQTNQQESAPAGLPKRGTPEAIAKGAAAIARARDVYSKLKTYQATFSVRKIQDYSDYNYSGLTEGRASCERPGKFRVAFSKTPNWGDCVMVSDGQKYWRSINQSEVFTEDPAPDFAAAQVFASDIVAENLPAEFYPVMRQSELPPLIFRTPREVIDARDEVLDGRPGIRVTCLAVPEADWDKPEAVADVVVEMWLDSESGVLGEMVRDSTLRTNKDAKDRQEIPTGEPPRIAKRVATITRLKDLRVNQPIDSTTFAFSPEKSWKKVAEFATGSGGDFGQYQTAGLPAPAFALKDLEGKTVSLSDLSGRVVLLDFWATWCGPCVAAMPHLQKLEEEFKNQPVSIIGINSDMGMSNEKIKAWLEKRKYTFAQLRESVDSPASSTYRVIGIPHTVLIDKNGVVQDVVVGYSGEKHGEILKDRIAKLLAGESLKTESEFKDLRKRGAKQQVANVFYVQSPGEQIPFTEVAPARLIGSSKVARSAAPWSARPFQLPNGNWVYLAPGSMAGASMSMFGVDDADTRTVVLEDIGSRYVFDWAPMVDAGNLRFLSFAGSPYNQGMGRKNCELFCHDPSGKKLWSVDLGLPEISSGEVKVAGGDLDRDGRAEVAALIRANEFQESGGRPREGKTLSKLCVFDHEGKLLASKQLELQNNVNITIIPDPADGRGTIVALGGGRVWRFKFDPAASSLKPDDSTPTQAVAPSP
jgi:thiol-disulfide isomerase/thioredoxin